MIYGQTVFTKIPKKTIHLDLYVDESKNRTYNGLITAIEYAEKTQNLTKRSWHISQSKIRKFFEIGKD